MQARPFWVNMQTLETQYKSPIPPGPMGMILVTVIGFIFLSALLGRIWFLWKYDPTLLFPTKEPKKKLQKWRRPKVKARGKLNQDGKGGRSANS